MNQYIKDLKYNKTNKINKKKENLMKYKYSNLRIHNYNSNNKIYRYFFNNFVINKIIFFL